jgi:hypothetical protein
MNRNMKVLTENQHVFVRRIDGTGRSYRAIVKGISSDYVTKFYILEMIDKLPGQKFSHITMIESCIDEV